MEIAAGLDDLPDALRDANLRGLRRQVNGEWHRDAIPSSG